MNKEILLKELKYKAIRSSGAGGQHVNKVSSKVELSFNVGNSLVLSEQQKERLLMKLGNRMTKDGVLVLQCDEARSQHQNKALVIKRFFLLLKNALTVPKKHKTTQPSKAAKERRLKAKRVAAEKKAHRKKPRLD